MKVASDTFLHKHGYMTREEEIREFGEALTARSYVCDECQDQVSSTKTEDGKHLCLDCFLRR